MMTINEKKWQNTESADSLGNLKIGNQLPFFKINSKRPLGEVLYFNYVVPKFKNELLIFFCVHSDRREK